MKKILLFIITLFVCVVCYGATFNQFWYIEDNTPIQTSCTTGGDIILPTPPTKYGYDFIGWEKVPLTRIEYINTNSVAMIDSGVIPTTTADLYIHMRFKVKQVLGAVNGIWGYMADNLYPRFGFFINGGFGCGLNDTLDLGISVTLNKIYDVYFENGVITLENSSRNIGTHDTNNTFMPVYFGGRGNNRGIDAWPSNIDIYEFEISYGDTHKYFIPVLDGNGTPCMFDKVEGKFYYNAGTGDFIAGPVIGGE